MGKDNIKGSVCLVTGGSRGIGAAIVKAVAAEGVKVAVNYFSSENKALELVSSLQAQGMSALAVRADVRNSADVEAMFASVEAEFGNIDMLVNNAGVSMRELVTDTSDEQWQQVMDTNLKGAFLCCRRALPHMIRQRYGRIVNMASIWGITGASFESVYAASKGGLIALSKSLASELAPSGITVNAIAPGPIETDLLIAELDDDERASLAEDIPAGRLGTAAEVASACRYFLSDDAAYINGQVLTIDGGWKP
ncbi:MAG: 3-oxoacyl-ACP reductase FabG [Syntrophomonadaceae bacterium]|nr:3-oxoacyl-ACP reductase FabG [Syntrophomonadaceae bacterium]